MNDAVSVSTARSALAKYWKDACNMMHGAQIFASDAGVCAV